MKIVHFETTKGDKVHVRLDCIIAVSQDRGQWIVWNTSRFGWDVSDEDALDLVEKMKNEE